MGRTASADQPAPTATRSPDRVVELRAELWRGHSLLDGMEPDDPRYDGAAHEILELTTEFLAVSRNRPASRRGWLPRPRSARDDRPVH